jgi:predicted permease
MPRHRREPWHVRAFRALVSLYPAAFRDEYRREMLLVFVDRDRGAAGAWARARLWLEALTGVLVEAPKEHARMLAQDLRYGVRVLRERALVTTTIVITLGLGIGLNTAMFSLVNAVVLRAMNLAGADDLYSVNLGERVVTGPESARLSGPMLERIEKAAPDGVSVTAMSRGIAQVHTRLDDGSATEPADLQLVSPTFFDVLDARPIVGRSFLDATDSTLGNGPVAVISYAYWQRRFGGARDVVGRSITINGAPFAIIGVGPQGFSGVWLETPVDIWVPLATQPVIKYSQSFSADHADPARPWMAQPTIWWLHVVVRAPDDKVIAARGAFNAAVSEAQGRDAGLVLDPFTRGFSRLRNEFRLPLYALTALAVLVLLVASANVSNLLLARAAERQSEIAVRMALGAGRGRLVHQLLTESVLLVLLAGTLSLAFARWAANGLARLVTPGTLPFTAGIDIRVLAFTAGVAFVSVLIFGVIPARHATRLDVSRALGTGARGAVGRISRGPARVLVVAQVALSLVLVTATGLVARSFQNLLEVDLGFERNQLVSVTLDPRLSNVPPANYQALFDRAVTAVRTVPGAASVALAMCGIQAGCRSIEDGLVIEGYRPRPDESVAFMVNGVGPDYFATVGMTMIAGRPIDASDVAGGRQVAVVNRTLARKYFPDGQAVGRRFGNDEADTEIVGIVNDARLIGPAASPMPTAYYPLAQKGGPVRASLEVRVRTTSRPEQIIPALRATLARAVPELPLESIVTMNERVERGMSPWRLILLMTSGFGVLALGLAGFGLFGVLSNAVARRTPEFGLRMALGASRAVVVWSVVREALWLVVIGLALGLPVVLLGGRLLSALLYGVRPFDAMTIASAVAVLVGIGATCSALPAIRVSRVDPSIALRQE